MTTDREELFDLFEALCDGAITPAAAPAAASSGLAADAAARQLYFDYLDLRLHLRQWQRASLGEQPSSGVDAPDAVPPAPIVIQTSPACMLHSPRFTLRWAASRSPTWRPR